MADLNRDLPETINHPKIKEFLSVCLEHCDEHVVSFTDFQSGPFQRFWASSIILKWDKEKHDFLYVLWGTELTKIYGLELTGKYIADGEHKDAENPFIKAHLEAMNGMSKVFLGGTIDWREKGCQTWHQVIQPLRRNGQISETLTYVSFEAPVRDGPN